MINYADTITMFYNCSFDIRNFFTTHWIWDHNSKKKDFHHFCVYTPSCFIRYFPNMFQKKRLYVTFSLPRFCHASKDNTFNVTNYFTLIFMTKLHQEFSMVIDTTIFPLPSLSDWQPSRIDLFRMRKICSMDRKEYHFAYSQLFYRGIQTKTYENTNYLASSNSRHPSLLLRTYNKTVEKQNKASMIFGNLPTVVEEFHEESMMEELTSFSSVSPNSPYDLFRYEFSFRRAAIKRYCDKYQVPLNMQTVMEEDFQKMLLNDLIKSRRLNCTIYSKKEFRNIIKTVLKSKKSIDLAIKLTESIRNKKPIPLTTSQRQRITKELYQHGISVITTNFVTIQGLTLL